MHRVFYIALSVSTIKDDELWNIYLPPGIKAKVAEHLVTFERYAFMWERDLAAEYSSFLATNPSLEARITLLPVTARKDVIDN
jgi:hypothetical protein